MAAAMLVASVTARDYANQIAYDCFQETQKAYGNETGTRVSDLDLLSGLTPEHQLTQIAGCFDNKSGLLTGVVSTYARWEWSEDFVRSYQSNNFSLFQPASSDGKWVDSYRMNVVGTLGRRTAFDDNASLASIGVAALTDEQARAFNTYWFSEANPRMELFYKSADPNNFSAW
jgi:hypothetical protein